MDGSSFFVGAGVRGVFLKKHPTPQNLPEKGCEIMRCVHCLAAGRRGRRPLHNDVFGSARANVAEIKVEMPFYCIFILLSP